MTFHCIDNIKEKNDTKVSDVASWLDECELEKMCVLVSVYEGCSFCDVHGSAICTVHKLHN